MDIKEQFSQIYDQYLDKIYRFIFFRVSNKELAQDLTSRVFFNFWKYLNNGSKAIENYSAYLYQSARNLLVDYYRHKKLEPLPFSVLDETQIFSSDQEKIEQNAELTAVYQALSRLKKEYAEILILYYLDDLTVPELSEVFKKREGAIRTMIHRAVKALKNELAGPKEL